MSKSKGFWYKGVPDFPILAYCYASGHVDYDAVCPAGALPMMFGKTVADLKQFLQPFLDPPAHGHTGYRVPGVGEAFDENESYEKFQQFLDGIDRLGTPPEVRSFRTHVGIEQVLLHLKNNPGNK